MAEIVPHLIASFLRITAVMAAAFITAYPLAVILGRRRALARLFDPLIELLYSVPKVSLFPLIIILAGLNDRARIITAALAVFFQVLITIRDAAAAIPGEYLTAIETLGAGRAGRIRWVYLPALLPASFSSIRVGTSAAFAVLFFTEASVTAGSGLGRLVAEKWSALDYPAMGAAVLVTAALGFLIFLFIDFLEKLLVKGGASGR